MVLYPGREVRPLVSTQVERKTIRKSDDFDNEVDEVEYDPDDDPSNEPDYEPEYDPDFQDPGGTSALRRATLSNPRNRPCPTCHEPNRLTPADVALSYQCDQCANALERGGY